MKAEVFLSGGGIRTALEFSQLELRFAPGNQWHQASWRFETLAGWLCYPANQVDAITTATDPFEVALVNDDERSTRRFRVHSTLSGYPSGSLCFLYSTNADGWWIGHTLKRSFGKIMVVSCSVDPA